MALDLHVLKEGRHTKLLYQIGHDEYMRMQPAINLYKKRTGIYIDEYKDMKFPYGLEVLINALKDSVPDGKKSLVAKEIASLIAVLEEADKNGTAVIFVDD